MKDIDIKSVMDDWPYEPDQNIRMARFSDGRILLQVRLPMGIEQYEVVGRPDGKRPHNHDSLLAFHLHRLETARKTGLEPVFRLDHEACTALFEESTLFYMRYVRLLEIEDWERTRADTEHNLRLFDLVHRYADKLDDRQHLEQWRPYLIRVHALAGAMIQMKKDRPAEAIQLLEDAVTLIKSIQPLDRTTFLQESRRAVSELTGLLRRIREQVPPSPVETLERELKKAVEAEDYEKAAELRDRLGSLRSEKEKPESTPP